MPMGVVAYILEMKERKNRGKGLIFSSLWCLSIFGLSEEIDHTATDTLWTGAQQHASVAVAPQQYMVPSSTAYSAYSGCQAGLLSCGVTLVPPYPFHPPTTPPLYPLTPPPSSHHSSPSHHSSLSHHSSPPPSHQSSPTHHSSPTHSAPFSHPHTTQVHLLSLTC